MVNKTNKAPLSSDQQVVYRSIADSLTYLLTRTPPYLAVAARILASRLHEPTEVLFVSAKHALRYLRGAVHHEMKIRQNDGI